MCIELGMFSRGIKWLWMRPRKAFFIEYSGANFELIEAVRIDGTFKLFTGGAQLTQTLTQTGI